MSPKLAVLMTVLLAVPLLLPTEVIAQPNDRLAQQVKTLLTAGGYLEAEKSARQAVQKNPNNADAYLFLGTALKLQNKLEAAQRAFLQAEALYRRTIAARPSATAYEGLGNTLFWQRQFTAAMAAYQAAIRLNPNDADSYIGLGRVLTEQLQFEAAIAAFRRAVQLNPNAVEAYCQLGSLRYLINGDAVLEEVVQLQRQAVQRRPQDPHGYECLGETLAIQGRQQKKKLKEAEALFRHALQLAPHRGTAYRGLGRILEAQGRLDEAVAAYRQAVTLTPADALGYFNLGNGFYQQKQSDAAIAAFRQSIQLDPFTSLAYSALETVLREQNRLSEIVPLYQQAIRLNPQSANSFNDQLGKVLKDLRRFDEAVAVYRQALTQSKNASFYVGLGDVFKEQQKYAEALSAYQQAQQTQLQPYGIEMRIGDVYFAQKQYELAVQFYRQATQTDQFNNPWFYVKLGDALSAQKQDAAAIAAYRQALDRKSTPILASLDNASNAVLSSLFNPDVFKKTAPAYAHNGLGILLQRQGRLQEAIAEFKQAISIDPTLTDAQTNLKQAEQLLRSQ